MYLFIYLYIYSMECFILIWLVLDLDPRNACGEVNQSIPVHLRALGSHSLRAQSSVY